jgi:hypothetical protein
VSQNNIRNNQNFNICNTTRRNGSTNNIKRKVKPGGSTLSRSIFAFLKNRDNTNVDSNPTKTSMNLKKIRLKENFQIGPMPPPSLPSVSGHLAPNRQSEGQEGKIRRAASPPGGRTTRGCATQPQTPTPAHPDKLFASAFLLGSPLLPPLPPAALLSQHHSHFLASPVGYLYERGDR